MRREFKQFIYIDINFDIIQCNIYYRVDVLHNVKLLKLTIAVAQTKGLVEKVNTYIENVARKLKQVFTSILILTEILLTLVTSAQNL